MSYGPSASWAARQSEVWQFHFADLNASQIFVYILLLVTGTYWALQRLDVFPLLPITQFLWNVLVYTTPPSIVMALDNHTAESLGKEMENLNTYSHSRTFATKSAAMRRIVGLDGTGIMSKLQRARSFSGVGQLIKGPAAQTLPGLGNFDNSCYQNSIIQGLAALRSLPRFLRQVGNGGDQDQENSTIAALDAIIGQLNAPENSGKRLWTPAALKSMSSWTQQDAQEYFSKVFSDLEDEAKRNSKMAKAHEGLRDVKRLSQKGDTVAPDELLGNQVSNLPSDETMTSATLHQSPLEGLTAQRVGCLRCGHVSELSMSPFNCITLLLENSWRSTYHIAECLDKFTGLESIEGVDCGRCTLLQQEEQLKSMISTTGMAGPQSLVASVTGRLRLVEEALQNDDYSENTISKRCQVPRKSRVSSTKTKQAVIARCPSSLVLHISRSVFDDTTSTLTKNNARVVFPKTIDLSLWCLGRTSDKEGADKQTWSTDPEVSLLAGTYQGPEEGSATRANRNEYSLRAIIIHQGRHENGHYICYRRDPVHDDEWWRLSDETVYSVSEEQVLGADGVYMLFYERIRDANETVLDDYDSIPAVATNAAMSSESPETVNHEPHGRNREPAEVETELVDSDATLPQAAMARLTQSEADNSEKASSDGQLQTEEEGQRNESQSIAPPMRTAGASKKRSKKGRQRGMPGMSNMVAAN